MATVVRRGKQTNIETYRRRNLSDRCVKRRQDLVPSFHASANQSIRVQTGSPNYHVPLYPANSPALLQHRPILDIHIKKMDLLISLRNLAALIDPQNRVFDLGGVDAGLVDANMDG